MHRGMGGGRVRKHPSLEAVEVVSEGAEVKTQVTRDISVDVLA